MGSRIEAWAEHQFAREAFGQVLEALSARGIDVLPVKGIILANTLYDAVEDRPMMDVDLRVRPRDLTRVADAARARGWDVRRTSRQLGTLEFTVSRTLIEVESSIGSPGVCAIGVDQMLARSVWRTGRLGILHREPELHDHALHLCVNVFKDKLVLAPPWAREDLLRIVATPGFSPEQLAVRAAEARLRSLVSIVADWLSDDPRGAGWGQVRRAVGAPRRRYATIYRALVQRAPRSVAMGLLARTASDTLSGRARALALGVAGTLLRVASNTLRGT